MPIRDAEPADAAACAAIYAPYVRDTAITFEIEPPGEDEMRERIVRDRERWAWVVLEEDGAVTGYAYAGLYRERAAYRWACEVSVYLGEQRSRRTGAGRALYDVLFERLAARGYLTVIAGITLPNPPSEGLHAAMGFEPIGTYRRIGYKHGAWHDVRWAQKALVPSSDAEPVDPR